MNGLSPLFPNRPSERGSTLFIVLIAVALFAALSYAISRDTGGAKNLSQEKLRLLASEIIETGHRVSETVSRLKLRGVSETDISFEHGADYVNAGCSTDACKFFAYDGGGLEWEDPPVDANNGESWGYTADFAAPNVGTSAADLVMFIPELSVDLCHRINVMLGLEDESGSPLNHPGAIDANQFTGSYNASPDTVPAGSVIDGQMSACFQLNTFDGTAVTGGPLSSSYIYYQVLIAR